MPLISTVTFGPYSVRAAASSLDQFFSFDGSIFSMSPCDAASAVWPVYIRIASKGGFEVLASSLASWSCASAGAITSSVPCAWTSGATILR